LCVASAKILSDNPKNGKFDSEDVRMFEVGISQLELAIKSENKD